MKLKAFIKCGQFPGITGIDVLDVVEKGQVTRVGENHCVPDRRTRYKPLFILNMEEGNDLSKELEQLGKDYDESIKAVQRKYQECLKTKLELRGQKVID